MRSRGNSHVYLLEDVPACVPHWLQYFTFPPAMYEGSDVSVPLPRLFLFPFLAAVQGREVVSHCGLD